MPSEALYRIWVYTGAGRQFQGWVADPVSINGTVRAFGVSALSLVTRATDPMNPYLADPTARVVVQYRGRDLPSFKVRDPSGSMLLGGQYTWQLQGDWREFQNATAWVRPTKPLQPTTLTANQDSSLGQAVQTGTTSGDGYVSGQSGYYQWPSTVPETAIKAVLRDNLITRLGKPIQMAADQQRGTALASSAMPLTRFGTLEETVQPILAASGLQLTIGQASGLADGQPTVVDIRVPDQWPQTLTARSGIIQDGTWNRKYPTITRGVLGGPGEDAAREFVGFQDATGLEALYADILEVFKDNTGAPLQWPDSLADTLQNPKYYRLRSDTPAQGLSDFNQSFAQAAAASLADGLPAATVSATLAETTNFRFGGLYGIQLGDAVVLQAGNGETFNSTVTEVDLAWSKESSSAVPKVGDVTLSDQDRALTSIIQRVIAAQRWLSTSR